jgi:hypothetical protein
MIENDELRLAPVATYQQIAWMWISMNESIDKDLLRKAGHQHFSNLRN